MPRPRLLDDAQSAEIVKRYKAGETIAELADAFEVSIQVIHRRLTEAGVERRPQGRHRPRADSRAIVRRYTAGASILQLAREHGIDRKAVRQILVDAGVRIVSNRRRSI